MRNICTAPRGNRRWGPCNTVCVVTVTSCWLNCVMAMFHASRSAAAVSASVSSATNPTQHEAEPAHDAAPTPASPTHGSTAASGPMPTKGDFVRGIVEAVNERSATVLLDSGHRAALSWSNFTKQADYKPQPDAASSSSPEGQPLPSLPLAAGDKVWACVLQVPKPDGKDGACVQLSTAALEVRPGDMLRQPKHVMAGLEQWAARGGRTPLQEWRGRLELEQFVAGNAGGGKGSKATTAAAAVAAAVAEPAAPAAVWGPGSWGLPLAPLPGRGDCVRGSVTSVKPYGVFLRLDSRHDGFIPLSQVRSGKWRERRERGIQFVGHPPLTQFTHNGCFTMQMYGHRHPKSSLLADQ